MIQLRRRRIPSTWVLYLYAAALYVFFYAPVLYIVIFSFNDSASITPPWRGFTLEPYRQVLGNSNLRDAFINSVTLGLATAVISVSMGTMLAIGFRSQFRGKAAIFNLLLLALLTPGIVLGVALTLFWRVLNLTPGLFGSTLV